MKKQFVAYETPSEMIVFFNSNQLTFNWFI